MYLDDFLDKAYSTISAKHTFNEQVTSKILPLKGELSPNQAEKTVLKIG